VRSVRAFLYRADAEGRRGVLVGSSGRGLTVHGRRVLTLRLRGRGLATGRYLLIVTGINASGRRGRATARVRFT
jgi:hypothetical protein